jgi:hypothetical protein
MNNVRYWFSNNQTSSYLFPWNNTGTGENEIEEKWATPRYTGGIPSGVGPTGTLSTEYNTVGNNDFIEAWYFPGSPVAGQRGDEGANGQVGWIPVPFEPPTNPREDLGIYVKGSAPPISENIYTALNTLFTTGGVTYDDTLLHLNALDNSNERQLATNNAGKNYNIWTPGDPAHTLNEGKTDWVEGLQSMTSATGRIDQWGCTYPYTSKTQEQILYNFDNITGSPLLIPPGSRNDFEKIFDVNRTVPNTRYLRVNSLPAGGDIDITFSYATELIKLQESTFYTDKQVSGQYLELEEHENGKAYLGARITLWTSADQQDAHETPTPVTEEKELLYSEG